VSYELDDLTRLVRTKTIICDCGCWIWTGALNQKKYPRFELRGQAWLVHRYAYEKLIGEIGEDMTLDHRMCTSHRCIHPGHMDVVSQSENSRRANETRWHDFKFDEDGNQVQRVRCESCVARDGGANDDGHARTRTGFHRGMDWADFPSDEEVNS